MTDHVQAIHRDIEYLSSMAYPYSATGAHFHANRAKGRLDALAAERDDWERLYENTSADLQIEIDRHKETQAENAALRAYVSFLENRCHAIAGELQGEATVDLFVAWARRKTGITPAMLGEETTP